MRKKQFKAESKKLLDMMINSIYTHKAVSYTHLTLPTKRIVEIPVVAAPLTKKKKAVCMWGWTI